MAQMKGTMTEETNKSNMQAKDKIDENQETPASESHISDSDIKMDTESNIELDELTKIKYELAELQDKYLRLYSDFDNYRRRTNKEKLDIIELASENIIVELMPVVDDFERAVKSMKDTADVHSVCEGINLIFIKLKKILEDKGLKEIDCLQKPFDPEFHDAITKIPAPSKKLRGKVVDQIQKGYLLKNKVIRHSKVIVGD